MKINVEIELDEIWADESNLAEELIHEIKRSVYSEIRTTIKEQVEREVTSVVMDLVEKNLSQKIAEFFDQIIKKETIIYGRRNIYDEHGQQKYVDECTIEQYIKSQIMERNTYSSIGKSIEKLAEEMSKDLKSRYDLLFASQVVSKMSDQGLLKDEAIAKLLGDAK